MALPGSVRRTPGNNKRDCAGFKNRLDLKYGSNHVVAFGEGGGVSTRALQPGMRCIPEKRLT